MTIIIKIILLFLLLFSNSYATSMKETVYMGVAGSALCKLYAEKLGGSVEQFSQMNVMTLKISERLGYTDDMPKFLDEIKSMKKVFQHELIKIHGSELNIYNDWCIRFLNSFVDSYNKELGR